MSTDTTISLPTTPRIDYLDLLKGFTILWIVWYHQPHPTFIDHYYHVPVFFFISGIVFKHKDIVSFVKGLVQHILIPFLFFYVTSYCFQIIRFLFESQSLSGFEWSQVFDVFKLEYHRDYLRINRPLWFLVSLAVVQTLYQLIYKLPRYCIFAICTIILLLKATITTWPTYFFFNQSIYWLTYFALGDIIGKQVVNKSKNNNTKKRYWRIYLIISCICLYSISLFFFRNTNNTTLCNFLYDLRVISFVFFSITLFSYFKGNNFLFRILRFYGKNSLTVLGTHLLFSITFGGFAFRLFGLTGNYWIGFAVFILTALIMYPTILFIRKFLPFCIGIN